MHRQGRTKRERKSEKRDSKTCITGRNVGHHEYPSYGNSDREPCNFSVFPRSSEIIIHGKTAAFGDKVLPSLPRNTGQRTRISPPFAQSLKRGVPAYIVPFRKKMAVFIGFLQRCPAELSSQVTGFPPALRNLCHSLTRRKTPDFPARLCEIPELPHGMSRLTAPILPDEQKKVRKTLQIPSGPVVAFPVISSSCHEERACHLRLQNFTLKPPVTHIPGCGI